MSQCTPQPLHKSHKNPPNNLRSRLHYKCHSYEHSLPLHYRCRLNEHSLPLRHNTTFTIASHNATTYSHLSTTTTIATYSSNTHHSLEGSEGNESRVVSWHNSKRECALEFVQRCTGCAGIFLNYHIWMEASAHSGLKSASKNPGPMLTLELWFVARSVSEWGHYSVLGPGGVWLRHRMTTVGQWGG